MNRFVKIVNGLKLLTFFAKCSISDSHNMFHLNYASVECLTFLHHFSHSPHLPSSPLKKGKIESFLKIGKKFLEKDSPVVTIFVKLLKEMAATCNQISLR